MQKKKKKRISKKYIESYQGISHFTDILKLTLLYYKFKFYNYNKEYTKV